MCGWGTQDIGRRRFSRVFASMRNLRLVGDGAPGHPEITEHSNSQDREGEN